MEEWLLSIMQRCNVPAPSVKPPKGEKENWKNKSKWVLLSRDQKLASVLHEHVVTKREDIIEKACEWIVVVRAEIVCFIDETKTWDEWTAPLKAARAVISQVKNRTTQLLLTNDRVEDLFGPGCKKKSGELSTFLYRHATTIQEEFSSEAAKKVSVLEKKEALLKREEQTEETAKALKEIARDLIINRARANLKLGGALRSVLSRSTMQAYDDWKSKSFKKDVPSMRPNQPIPLRAGSKTRGVDRPEWNIEESNKGYKISFLVCTHFGRQYASVKVTGGNHHATVQKYLRGEASRRDAKIFYDERRKRWVIAMTFGLPRKKPVEGGSVAAIRVGVQDFISILDDQGNFRNLETFHKIGYEMKSSEMYRQRILPRKLEFKQLKKDARKDRNFQGSGAKGHGEARFNKAYNRYRDAEARFVKTWIGQISAAAVRHCTHAPQVITKVYLGQMTTVVPDYILENYMPEEVAWIIKTFPFCALHDGIVRAFEKAGCEVVITSDDRDCDTCPSCGHIDVQNHNPKTCKFWCINCDMRLSADYVAAWNYLKKNGADCSKIQKRAEYIQEWRLKMDEKASFIKEEEQEFFDAHKAQPEEQQSTV